MLLGRGIEAPRPQDASAAACAGRPGTSVSRFAEDLPERALPPLHARRETCWRACRARAGWCASQPDRDGDGRSDGRRRGGGRPQPAARPRPRRRLALRGGDRRDRPDPLRSRDRARPRASSSGSSPACPAAATTGRARCASARTAGCTSRSARPATCASRGRPAAGGDDALPAGRVGRGGLRDGPSQLGRLRLAAGGRADLRDGQRPRPAGRRLPAVRAEPRGAGRVLRLAGGERGPRARPGLREGPGGPDRGVDPARPRLPRPQRPARHDVPAGRGRAGRQYRGAAVVALHGSWNRTRKDGYKVVSLHWGAGRGHRGERLPDRLPRGDRRRRHRAAGGRGGGPGRFGLRLRRLRGLDLPGGVEGRSPAGRQAPSAGAVAASPAPAVPASTSVAPEVQARGQALWDRYACAACHDPKAATPGMVDEAARGPRRGATTPPRSPAYLRTPQPPMPAFDLVGRPSARTWPLFLLARAPVRGWA